MRRQRRIRIGVCIFLLFLLGVIGLAIRVQAQQPNLDEAIKAVVRIRGCNSAGCNVGLGSGVIIHPSGVILTANHVTLTDANNPLSPRLEDFVIEVTENARQAPQARYRARLLAAKPESDLALLAIYWDELTNQPLDGTTEVHLPTLASADASTIGFSDQLHILGYPLAGGASINYTEAALGGFDENGTLLKVNASLNEGYSGGPTLVERDGHYEIAGVVIRRRADVSLIRSIDQLHSLTWEPSARRVWADNVQVTAQGNAADATVKVSADIHALDYVKGDGRLLAYVFDANTRQPWPVGDSNLDRSANGQLVLRQVFSATQMVDVLPQQTLTLSLRQLNTQADQLVFRLVLWDMNETHVLWQDEQWRRPDQGANAVAIAPTPTSTATLLPTPMPAPTATDTPVPTPTETDTPIPTNTPAPTATDTPLSTSTPTPSATNTLLPTNTSSDTSTPDLRVEGTAAVATIMAAIDASSTKALSFRINSIDDAVYVLVPSGEFMMGSDDGEDDEKPVHRVYLDEFWIMRTEVTNAQYKKCVTASVCAQPNNHSWDNRGQANYPLMNVDWQQASTYAKWVGGRLPTEAEWEKAACGTDGRIYPWGNEAPDDQRLNYDFTTEVGSYLLGQSPYGALDMAGNVWEWTSSQYQPYPYQADDGREDLSAEARRVVRGGAWFHGPYGVRCASRFDVASVFRDSFYGFRVVSPGR